MSNTHTPATSLDQADFDRAVAKARRLAVDTGATHVVGIIAEAASGTAHLDGYYVAHWMDWSDQVRRNNAVYIANPAEMADEAAGL